MDFLWGLIIFTCIVSGSLSDDATDMSLMESEMDGLHSRIELETIDFLTKMDHGSPADLNINHLWHSFSVELGFQNREKINLINITEIATHSSCGIKAVWNSLVWYNGILMFCGCEKGLTIYLCSDESISKLQDYDVGDVFTISHMRYGNMYVIFGTRSEGKFKVQWGLLNPDGSLINLEYFDFEDSFTGIEALSTPIPILLLVQSHQDFETYYKRFTVYRGEKYNSTVFFRGFDSIPVHSPRDMKLVDIESNIYVAVVEERSVIVWQHVKECTESFKRFKVHQIIYFLGCQNLGFLKVDHEAFLFLAGDPHTQVYRWDGFMFVEFQTIPHPNSYVVVGKLSHLIETPVVFLLHNSTGGIASSFYLYSHSIGHFQKSSQLCIPNDSSTGSSCQSGSVLLAGNPLVISNGVGTNIVFPTHDKVKVFELKYEQVELENPVMEEVNKIIEKSGEIQSLFAQLLDLVTQIKVGLNQSVLETTSFGNLSILGNLKSRENIMSSALTLLNFTDWEPMSLDSLFDVEIQISNLLAKVDDIHSNISQLTNYQSADLIVMSGVEVKKITTHSLYLERMLDKEVPRFAQLSLTGPGVSRTVRGNIHTNDLMAATINNVSISQFVVDSISGVIRGPKHFNKSVCIARIDGKFSSGGMNVSNVLTLDDEHQSSGLLVFKDGVNVQELDVQGRIDEVQLNHIASNSLLISRPQKVHIGKIFSGNISTTSLSVSGTINQVRVASFMEIARKDISQVFLYPVNIANLVKCAEVEVLSKLNDLWFPEDVASINSLTLWGYKMFKSAVVDIIEAEMICKQSYSSYVNLQGNANMGYMKFNGRVLLNYTRRHNGSRPLDTRNIFVGPVFFKAGINTKLVNEIDSRELLGNLVQRSDPVIAFSGSKTLSGVTVNKMILQSYLNGVSMLDLVRTDVSSSLKGLVVFKSNIKLANATIQGKLDDCMLNALVRETVRLSFAQEILGSLHIKIVWASHLQVVGQLNGLMLDTVATRGNSEIRSSLVFKQKTVASFCAAYSVEIQSGTLAEFDLNLHNRTVTLSTQQSWKYFSSAGSVKVISDLSVKLVNQLRDEDLNSMWSPVGTTAVRYLDRLNVMGDMITQTGISGVKLSDVEGILIKDPDVIKNVMHFKSVAFLDVHLGNLCDVNLVHLLNDAVFVKGVNTIAGSKYFTTSIQTVELVAFHVNGIAKLSEENINPEYARNGLNGNLDNLRVLGNLTYLGKLGNVDIDELFELVEGLEEASIMTKSTEIGPIHLVNLEVLASNGEQNLFKNAIHVGSREFYELLPKKSHNIYSLYVEANFINGIYITELLKDLVLRHEDATISGSKIVGYGTFKNIICIKELLSDGVVNGLYIDELIQTSMMMLGAQKSMTFIMDVVDVHDLSVVSLNKIPLFDYLLTNFPQELHAYYYIVTANCLQDLTAFSVNRIYLPVTYSMTAFLEENQTIISPKVITGTITVLGNLSTAAFREHYTSVVPLNRSGQIITAHKFLSASFAKLHVLGDLNYPERLGSLMQINGDLSLDKTVVFNENVGFLGNIMGEFLVNGVDLSNLIIEVTEIKKKLIRTVKAFSHEKGQYCEKLKSMMEQLRNFPNFVDYYKIEREWHFDSIGSMYSFYHATKIYMILTVLDSGCSRSVIVSHPDSTYIETLDVTNVATWTGVAYGASQVLISVSTASSNCGSANSVGVWLFVGSNVTWVQNINLPARSPIVLSENGLPVLVFHSSDTLSIWKWSHEGGEKFVLISDTIPCVGLFVVIDLSNLFIVTLTSVGSRVYSIDGQFLSTLPTFNPKMFKVLNQGNMSYMAAVEQEDSKIFSPQVLVKLYSVKLTNGSISLDLFQVLPSSETYDVLFLYSKGLDDSETYMFLIKNCSGVSIYHLNGASGFEHQMTLPIFPINYADVNFYGDTAISNSYLAVANSNKITLYYANTRPAFVASNVSCAGLDFTLNLLDHSTEPSNSLTREDFSQIDLVVQQLLNHTFSYEDLKSVINSIEMEYHQSSDSRKSYLKLIYNYLDGMLSHFLHEKFSFSRLESVLKLVKLVLGKI